MAIQVRDRRTHIEYDRHAHEHVVVLTLDPEEAENIAACLPPNDGAYRELFEAAAEARAADGIEEPE